MTGNRRPGRSVLTVRMLQALGGSAAVHAASVRACIAGLVGNCVLVGESPQQSRGHSAAITRHLGRARKAWWRCHVRCRIDMMHSMAGVY
jgi:hypothetical protein